MGVVHIRVHIPVVHIPEGRGRRGRAEGGVRGW
jgi:hypothetical protein